MTPDEHTNQEFFLDVGAGHRLYVQDWGNAAAKVATVYVHGGPGGHCTSDDKQKFIPAKQRVIFFDQRGCGNSIAADVLKDNTTEKLVEDIEKIAGHLELQQLILWGGSWGSCLALAYALKHPERVKAMVLRGIFTGSKAEIEWVSKGRFAPYFPDVWDRYLDATPAKYHDDPSSYHFKRILGGDTEAAKQSAYAYENVEGALIRLDDRYAAGDFEAYDHTGIRMEVHYLTNSCFLPDRHILDNARKLTMPVYLVQGRYDMVCPPVTAYELSQKLPNARLVWTVAGHSGGDRANWDTAQIILYQLTAGS